MSNFSNKYYFDNIFVAYFGPRSKSVKNNVMRKNNKKSIYRSH